MSYKNIHDFKVFPVLYCTQRTRIIFNAFKKIKRGSSSHQVVVIDMVVIQRNRVFRFLFLHEEILKPPCKNLSCCMFLSTDAWMHFYLSLSPPSLLSFSFSLPLSLLLSFYFISYLSVKSLIPDKVNQNRYIVSKNCF